MKKQQEKNTRKMIQILNKRTHSYEQAECNEKSNQEKETARNASTLDNITT